MSDATGADAAGAREILLRAQSVEDGVATSGPREMGEAWLDSSMVTGAPIRSATHHFVAELDRPAKDLPELRRGRELRDRLIAP